MFSSSRNSRMILRFMDCFVPAYPQIPPESDSRLPCGAFFDTFGVVCALENCVDEDAGRVDLVGREFARLDELLHFGDDVIGSSGHHGIEVARGFAIDQIAHAIALPSLDQGEIAAKGSFEDVMPTVEIASFFSLRDQGAVAGWSIKRGDAGAAGAQALREGTLRIYLHLQLAAENQLLEKFIFANIGRDHFFDLAILK